MTPELVLTALGSTLSRDELKRRVGVLQQALREATKCCTWQSRRVVELEAAMQDARAAAQRASDILGMSHLQLLPGVDWERVLGEAEWERLRDAVSLVKKALAPRKQRRPT